MLHQTIPEQAAAYLFHLVQNNPFVDGIKRVGFAATGAFLRINGCRLEMREGEAFRTVMGVEAGEMNKEELTKLLERKIARTDPVRAPRS
jgi:death on curing protein